MEGCAPGVAGHGGDPAGLPLTEIAGDRRVLIENHLGITEYGPEKIQVRVRFGAICVQGLRPAAGIDGPRTGW